MRSDGVTKQRAVLAFSQPVFAAVLFIGPPRRQGIYGCQFVVNDGPVAHPRPDQSITMRFEGLKQPLKSSGFDDGLIFDVEIRIHKGSR
jgi:hypothetical protein